MVLKRIGPVSVARISGTIYAIFGLVIGAILSAVSLAGMAMQPAEGPAIAAQMFGVGAIIWLPLLYGAVGFIASLIAAALYNVFANLVGGIELQLE